MVTSSIYITYWSLEDPLCRSQTLAYLRGLGRLGHRSALLTFEQPRYAMLPDRIRLVQAELAAEGIYWYPLRYHRRPALAATAFDCLCGIVKGLHVSARHRPCLIHSRSSVPAVMATMLSWLIRTKFLYDADSRLSDEYADIGHWDRRSYACRLLAWFEKLAMRRADAVVVLTERFKRQASGEARPSTPVVVIPCCVSTMAFQFDPAVRFARRKQLGLAAETLFVYLGKTGLRYLVEESFEFFRRAREQIGPSRFLILSGDEPDAFAAAAARAGLEKSDVHVIRANPFDVAGWLSAADVGLSLIRPTPSENASSPIKIGEYLSVGLPVVITAGIGDSSEMIERLEIGVVLDGSKPTDYSRGVDRLLRLLNEGDELRTRCRRAAEEYLDLETSGVQKYYDLYDMLFKMTLHDIGAS